MRLIGFNGGMGCGKSEAIKTLTELTGNDGNVVLVKFAGVLYKMQEMLYEEIKPVYQRPADFAKDRKLLQWLGTEWGRGLNQNLWVELWKAKVAQEVSFNPNVIIVCDDVRFDNEAEVLKSLGGSVVKLVRSNNQSHAHGGVGIANHASEAGISDKYVDFIVENNSSLLSYKNSLTSLYSMMGLIGDNNATEQHA